MQPHIVLVSVQILVIISFTVNWIDQAEDYLAPPRTGFLFFSHGECMAVGFSVSGISLSNQTDSIYASMSILSCRLCRYLVQVSCRLSSTPRRDFSA